MIANEIWTKTKMIKVETKKYIIRKNWIISIVKLSLDVTMDPTKQEIVQPLRYWSITNRSIEWKNESENKNNHDITNKRKI